MSTAVDLHPDELEVSDLEGAELCAAGLAERVARMRAPRGARPRKKVTAR